MLADTEEFKAALERVRLTIDTDNPVRAYRYFCFRNNTISTFNGGLGTVTKFECPGWDFCVEADKLWKIVGRLPKESVALKVDGKFVITGSDYIYSLPITDTEAFPELEVPPEEPVIICVEQERFISALKAVSLSLPKSTTNIHDILNAIGFSLDSIFTTTGPVICSAVALSEYKFPAVSLSTSALASLLRLNPASMSFYNNCVIASTPSTTLYIRQKRQLMPFLDLRQAQKIHMSSKIDIPDSLVKVVERFSGALKKDTGLLDIRGDGITTKFYYEAGGVVCKAELPIPISESFKIDITEFLTALKKLKPKTMDLGDLRFGDGKKICLEGHGYNYCISVQRN